MGLTPKKFHKANDFLKINGLLSLEIENEQLKVSKLLLKNLFRIEHNIKDYRDNKGV